MDIKTLEKMGGIVSSEPVLVEVKWDDRIPVPDTSGRNPTRTVRADDGGHLVEPNPEWDETYIGEMSTFQVRIKQLSYGDVERIRSQPIDPEKPNRSANALLIAESVLVGEEGDDQFTYEQAYQLKPTLAAALLKAIGESTAVKS